MKVTLGPGFMSDEQIAQRLREGKSAMNLYIFCGIPKTKSTEIRKKFNIPAVKQSWRGDVTKA